MLEFLLDGFPGEPAGVRVVLVHLEVALRRDDGLLALALEGFAEDALALAPGVHVRGIEEVHAEVERAVDECLALLFVEHPVAPVARPETHAPQADPGHLDAGSAECRVLHGRRNDAGNQNGTASGERQRGRRPDEDHAGVLSID